MLLFGNSGHRLLRAADETRQIIVFNLVHSRADASDKPTMVARA